MYVCVCMFVRVNVGKCKVEKRYFQKMQKEKKRRFKYFKINYLVELSHGATYLSKIKIKKIRVNFL